MSGASHSLLYCLPDLSTGSRFVLVAQCTVESLRRIPLKYPIGLPAVLQAEDPSIRLDSLAWINLRILQVSNPYRLFVTVHNRLMFTHRITSIQSMGRSGYPRLPVCGCPWYIPSVL